MKGMKQARTLRRGRFEEGGGDRPKRIVSDAVLAVPDDGGLDETEFQVLKVGEYHDSRYGTFSITPEMIGTMKANFDSKVLGTEVALDVNHDAAGGAFAWVKSLSVRDDSLWAKFKDFSEKGKKMLLDRVFKYFSVEFAPITKVEAGKKVTINTVLRGIAMTNRPVIKGMQPTFLSEDFDRSHLDNSQDDSSMKALKAYAESLLKRGKITRAEADAMKLMAGTLSEDEKKDADVISLSEKVEAEVAKTEAEAKKLAEEDEAKKKAGAQTDAMKLADAQKTIEENGKQLAEMKARQDARDLSESVAGVTLSEKNLTGFAAASKEKVEAFIGSLSAEQRVKFSEIVKEVKTVTLGEIGHGGAGEKKDAAGKEAKLAEAKTEAEKRAKEKNVPLHIALAEVYKEKGLTGDESAN